MYIAAGCAPPRPPPAPNPSDSHRYRTGVSLLALAYSTPLSALANLVPIFCADSASCSVRTCLRGPCARRSADIVVVHGDIDTRPEGDAGAASGVVSGMMR